MFAAARALARPAVQQVRQCHGHSEFPADVKVGRACVLLRARAHAALTPSAAFCCLPWHASSRATRRAQAKGARMIVEATVAGTVTAFMWKSYHNGEKAKARA
jgi:hypothetical protein